MPLSVCLPNIFFGTGIPTLIMVLKQHRDNDDVLIIDASKGFVKDGKSNELRACDVRRIADCMRDRKTIAGYSRVVSRDEIRENGYNLNIPRYVDSSEAAEEFDIYATVFGGIPQSEIDGLSRYWDALPSLRAQLFANKADGSPYADVSVSDLTAAIEANADVVALKAKFAGAFADFKQVLHVRLIDSYDSVKDMAEMEAISQDILPVCRVWSWWILIGLPSVGGPMARHYGGYRNPTDRGLRCGTHGGASLQDEEGC